MSDYEPLETALSVCIRFRKLTSARKRREIIIIIIIMKQKQCYQARFSEIFRVERLSSSHSKLAISLVDQKKYVMAQRSQEDSKMEMAILCKLNSKFRSNWLEPKSGVPPKVVCLFRKISV